jgi:hypothetical protein
MKACPLSELLRLPVRTRGIQLARPVDAVVDSFHRLVGFEVVSRDGARRFLPLAAVDVREDELSVSSSLVLLEEREIAYYRRRTTPVRELGFAEPWVGEDGTVVDAVTAA